MTPDTTLDAADVLRRHGLRPRHSLGQNFLEDASALLQVVRAAEVSPDDVVLEIGTGIGSLTRYLGQAARRVVGVEVDAALAAICRQELRGPVEYRNRARGRSRHYAPVTGAAARLHRGSQHPILHYVADLEAPA